MTAKTMTIPVPGSREKITVQRDMRNPVGPFRCVGIGMSNQYGSTLDPFEIMVNLDKPQRQLLSDLVKSYDPETGFSNMLPWKNQSYFSEALVALKKLQLVVRVKKGQYMLNPNLIVNPKHYLRLVLVWGDLVKSE